MEADTIITWEAVQSALARFLEKYNDNVTIQVSKWEDAGESVRYLVSVGKDLYIMEWITRHDLVLLYELQECSIVIKGTLHRFNRIGSMVNIYAIDTSRGIVEIEKLDNKQFVYNEVNTLL